MLRVIEGLGDNDRYRLAVEADLIVLEDVQSFSDGRVDERALLAIGQPRRVVMGDNSENAGPARDLGSVDSSNPP
jgi:hypothetical protein